MLLIALVTFAACCSVNAFHNAFNVPKFFMHVKSSAATHANKKATSVPTLGTGLDQVCFVTLVCFNQLVVDIFVFLV